MGTFATKLWLVHAGCGKTHLAKSRDDILDMTVIKYKYLDVPEVEPSEESEQAKASFYEMNPEWPQNYFKALVREVRSGTYRHVFAPSLSLLPTHLMLEEPPIPYALVYPHPSLKDEYERRYKERGNSDEFLGIFIGGWDIWMDSLKRMRAIYEPDECYVLKRGQYLSDVIGE